MFKINGFAEEGVLFLGEYTVASNSLGTTDLVNQTHLPGISTVQIYLSPVTHFPYLSPYKQNFCPIMEVQHGSDQVSLC